MYSYFVKIYKFGIAMDRTQASVPDLQLISTDTPPPRFACSISIVYTYIQMLQIKM